MTPAEVLQALLEDRRLALGSTHRKRIAAALIALRSDWPTSCHKPNSCSRNKRCMYIGCKYEGVDIAPAVSRQERS